MPFYMNFSNSARISAFLTRMAILRINKFNDIGQTLTKLAKI